MSSLGKKSKFFRESTRLIYMFPSWWVQTSKLLQIYFSNILKVITLTIREAVRTVRHNV